MAPQMSLTQAGLLFIPCQELGHETLIFNEAWLNKGSERYNHDGTQNC